jgi:molybdopterin-guanine dinucleotide biosynthesis protein A
MKIAAVIIAGGRSSRMGREKALIEIAGRPMLNWIIDRIAPQADILAINTNSDTLSGTGLPVIADLRHDIGTPLAGLHAALSFAVAQGADQLLTVPSDCPFLPRDLVKRLGTRAPAIATTNAGPHYLTGLWPASLLSKIEAASVRRVQDWVSFSRACKVGWPSDPYDPFFNVNTPEDLVEAERIAAEFGACAR